jgi:CelD/BcsL family acetyltransferase involved in cellulose biosynthesis
MAISVLREDVASLATAWAALLERAAEPVPFLHPTWQRVWLEEFAGDRELQLYAVRDGEELIGVAPLLRSDGRLMLSGDFKICDYMDIVAAPNRSGDVLDALLSTLAAEAWEQIDLWGLREDSQVLAALPAAVERAGLACELETEAVAPRIGLAGTWDEYVGSLSKKDRHELRRKLRKLEGAGELELRCYTSPEETESRVPLLLRMMVESRTDKASFMSEQMARFFHQMVPELAREGLVRLYELELEGRSIASILCFDQGGQFYLYNSGYEPEYAAMSAGLVSKALCVRDAVESGRHCVDTLRGAEPYKYDLGAKDRTVYTCTVRRK